jgi:transcriptional regulator with XRE-family HTH domain
MERAQLSTAQGKERPLLIAARVRMHYSLEEVAERLGVSKTTVYRWEKKGDLPQPYHLRKLCTLFDVTARELGFDELDAVDVQTMNGRENEEAEEESVLTTFQKQNLISRLMRIIWNWPPGDARYQKLQLLIMLELEDNSMHDEMSRRDALRFLALVPADMLGLSQFYAVFKKGVSHEDILKYCAAGIVACWQLRKGKELAFADRAVSKYIPTLKAMAQSAPATQKKAAADLVAQCFLLKAVLSWAVATPHDAIAYAQQAETYGAIAGSRLLRVTALRARAAALSYADHWEQALQEAEKAKSLLEERDQRDKQKQSSVSSQPAEEPIPQIVHSYVYAGLATYQAYHGYQYKEGALLSLKKAHMTFFAQSDQEVAPIWIDHHIGNLLINDGETYTHLGMYSEALDSLGQIETQYAQDTTIPLTNRVNALTSQIMAEVNRDDKPRDVQWCIDQWEQAIKGAKELKSNLRFNAAIQTYTAMRAAWPAEKQVKDLREHIVHW